MHYLLIGNGPSALASEQGAAIDAFPGQVVRFNNYHTKNYEKFVGSRTDVWATCDSYPPGKVYAHKARWWLGSESDANHAKTRESVGASIPEPMWRKVPELAENDHPSSGMNLCAWLLSKGHEVTLWGFDFMQNLRDHHYGDRADRGPWHEHKKEFLYFQNLLDKKEIEYLGWNKRTQGIPLVRQPVPCGTDANITAMREHSQPGWYQWACEQFTFGDKILDVGAGSCGGLTIIRKAGFDALGFDQDQRLLQIDPTLIIAPTLADIGNKKFDWVTCIDVIEHIVDDVEAFHHMCRIARKGVILSTPNGERSGCRNTAHCREYTIAQFANVFKPRELWSGSPDGLVHRTKLLEQSGNWVVDLSPQGPDNELKAKAKAYHAYPVGNVPHEVAFNHTVDGEIWPHISAIVDPI